MAGILRPLIRAYARWFFPSTVRAVKLRSLLCLLIFVAWAPFGLAVLFLFDAPGALSDPVAWVMVSYVWFYPLLFLISLPLSWLALKKKEVEKAGRFATLPLWYAKALVVTGLSFYLALTP